MAGHLLPCAVTVEYRVPDASGLLTGVLGLMVNSMVNYIVFGQSIQNLSFQKRG
jgi:hypothetical protein